ncbi:uncharacterized protein LOC111914194 isoform X2 [Lactuca sativa]|uniref:uncharacterized protein LOC111914194 isoform X2 n=1 Tax=Lactuca sativa TaxID=4236 RepID=UPI000CD8C4E2|nr:uncharacterized protein LOC111914194 isoform X2 [Lactuca sativa]
MSKIINYWCEEKDGFLLLSSLIQAKWLLRDPNLGINKKIKIKRCRTRRTTTTTFLLLLHNHHHHLTRTSHFCRFFLGRNSLDQLHTLDPHLKDHLEVTKYVK